MESCVASIAQAWAGTSKRNFWRVSSPSSTSTLSLWRVSSELHDNTSAMGLRYRSFVSACQAGHVTALGGPEQPTINLPGASELDDQEAEDMKKKGCSRRSAANTRILCPCQVSAEPTARNTPQHSWPRFGVPCGLGISSRGRRPTFVHSLFSTEVFPQTW